MQKGRQKEPRKSVKSPKTPKKGAELGGARRRGCRVRLQSKKPQYGDVIKWAAISKGWKRRYRATEPWTNENQNIEAREAVTIILPLIKWKVGENPTLSPRTMSALLLTKRAEPEPRSSVPGRGRSAWCERPTERPLERRRANEWRLPGAIVSADFPKNRENFEKILKMPAPFSRVPFAPSEFRKFADFFELRSAGFAEIDWEPRFRFSKIDINLASGFSENRRESRLRFFKNRRGPSPRVFQPSSRVFRFKNWWKARFWRMFSR